jgi:hypothetical protein
MKKIPADTPPGSNGDGLAVDARVAVHPGTPEEQTGVVVDDFGDDAGSPVEIGEHRIVGAARRWAVRLDSGELVFVDSDDLAVRP